MDRCRLMSARPRKGSHDDEMSATGAPASVGVDRLRHPAAVRVPASRGPGPSRARLAAEHPPAGLAPLATGAGGREPSSSLIRLRLRPSPSFWCMVHDAHPLALFPLRCSPLIARRCRNYTTLQALTAILGFSGGG